MGNKDKVDKVRNPSLTMPIDFDKLSLNILLGLKGLSQKVAFIYNFL